MQIYKAKFKSKKTCVCIIDDLSFYDSWTKELVKNRADYTITNLTGINYDVVVGKDENTLLRYAAGKYQYAIVISAATEFINGSQFFDNHPDQFNGIIGHILDGGDAYYGLHYQCYSINLKTYKQLGMPDVGADQPFATHMQTIPFRSNNSVHDEYLPFWINNGIDKQKYKHRIHGWNLISKFLEIDADISCYSDNCREHKNYLYREGNTNTYAYQKYNYCLTTHVHTKATGNAEKYPRTYNTPVQILVTIANKDAAAKRLYGYPAEIIYYDYNKKALEEVGGGHCIDPIHNPQSLINIIPTHNPKGTVIDLSNIFAYEGSAALLPLKYRIQQENTLVLLLQETMPLATVIFDKRAAEGFTTWKSETGLVADLKITQWNDLNLPSWHL
jgi:hypothetical protein|tara:strand:+ start:13796 stop:14959 length:1164 start_codon:yes stop_codon:yes gene_type:complete